MQAKFSVLISIYIKSKAEEVSECLSSIASQTLIPQETVIVLDGPILENTREVLKKFKEILNIRIVDIEKNVGLGAALNVGLASCKYGLIARIDSDDICTPERFEIQLPSFSHSADLTLVGSDIILFNEIGKIGYRKVPVTQTEIVKFSKHRNPFNHSTVMFRKDDILRIGGYPEVRYSQDYLLWLKCIKNGFVLKNRFKSYKYFSKKDF